MRAAQGTKAQGTRLATGGGGHAGRDHETAWPAALGEADGERVHRLWRDKAKALRVLLRR